MSEERGSGSVLSIGVSAVVVVLTALLLPLYLAFAAKQTAVAAADAAALAAADVAAGIVPGYPCQAAAVVAAANRAILSECVVDGLVATVRVGSSIVGMPLFVTATAGPPDGVN